MAKLIKLTSEYITAAVKAFAEALTKGAYSDGKVEFKIGTVQRKAKVIFKEKAWLKQDMLVREWTKEIAWHGIARRGDGEDEYIIEDILVYPQEVTGATVTTDQNEYQMWLMSQPDEVFNNIRMQGHSHVNMGVTPSGVDENIYDNLLAQLTPDMFYIFMIWNKRGDKTIRIYDNKENVFFDTNDCEVSIEEEVGLQTFLEEAKAVVKEKSYVVTQYSNTQTITQTKSKTEEKEDKKEEKSTKGSEDKDKKEKKRKGKRKAEKSYDRYDLSDEDEAWYRMFKHNDCYYY